MVLAWFFPYFESIHSANELSRLYLAMALVEDGSVSIDRQRDRLGDIHDTALRDGKRYSDKAPGAAFWAAPALWVYYTIADQPTLRGSMRIARLWVSTIPTAFLLLALLGFLREHLRDDRLRRLLVGVYALGTPATTYSLLLFGHQLSAVLVFGTFLAARRARPVAGALAAAAVCVEYQNALFVLPLAVLYLIRTRFRPRPLLLGLGAALPFAFVLGAYHQAAFGSPFTTGYSFVASHFAEVHAQGLMGVSWPRTEHLALCFVSPSKGLLFWSPVLALGFLGLPLLYGREDGPITGVMVALYSLFVLGMIYPVGGWSVSLRHLTPIAPWLLLPIGLLVARLRHARPVFSGLAACALVLTGISTVVWPHYAEHLRNPFFQIGWPLARDGWFPESLASGAGITSEASLIVVAGLCVVALLGDLVGSARSHLERVSWTLAAAALCAGLLASVAPLHSDQDVSGDLTWIQSVYEVDSAK